MTKSIRNQLGYTKEFIAATAAPELYVVSDCWANWWWNHISTSNLRLSRLGIDHILQKTKLPYYQISLPKPLRNKDLITLARLFTCPYYITKLDKIVLLGEEETVLLKLHADNIHQYLDNLQI